MADRACQPFPRCSLFFRNVSALAFLFPACRFLSAHPHFSFFPSFVASSSTRLRSFFSDNIKVRIVLQRRLTDRSTSWRSVAVLVPRLSGTQRTSTTLHLSTCCVRARRADRRSRDPLATTPSAEPWCNSAKLSPETRVRTLTHR